MMVKEDDFCGDLAKCVGISFADVPKLGDGPHRQPYLMTQHSRFNFPFQTQRPSELTPMTLTRESMA